MVVMNCMTKLAEKHPFAWLSGNDTLQFLMLGCEGAGKTTLLYRLKIDSWKDEGKDGKDEGKISADMRKMREGALDNPDIDVRDPSYHYEEFISTGIGGIGKYGIWDVPGSEPLCRMWPMFYRYLRMDALLYVVDCFSADRESLDRIFKARRQLFRLLNENELRCAAVVLVLNVRSDAAVQGGGPSDGDQPRAETSRPSKPAGRRSRQSLSSAPDSAQMEAAEEELAKEAEMRQCFYEMLGVPEIEESTAHRKRFFKHAISCVDISQGDEEWAQVLKDIYKAYTQVGEASMPAGGGG